MPTRLEDPAAVLAELDRVRANVLRDQAEMIARWRAELPLDRYAADAANLAAYIALRRIDLTDLQPRLAALGLSSLGRCEGHVLATLEAVISALCRMCRKIRPRARRARDASIADATLALRQATSRLLGASSPERRSRFMVTLPSEAARDARFVDSLVEHGMDCARINAAHDDVDAWTAMVRQVKRAAAHRGRLVRILVDLPGPKLRTGAMPPGEAVLHVRVKRGPRGEVLAPVRMVLDARGGPGREADPDSEANAPYPRLSVPAEWLRGLRLGDEVHFRDLQRRKRLLRVVRRTGAKQVTVESDRGAYIAPGIAFEHRSGSKAVARALVGPYAAPPAVIRIMTGDRLLLSPRADAAQLERRHADGRIAAPAVISCAEPLVFEHLQPGHRVKIDDGKIDAVVERMDRRGAWLRVDHAPPRGAKLGPDKGLNFPDTRLPAHGLDQRDQAALSFAATHADIVGYSFVQTGAEMDELHRRIAALTRRKLGVIAKIETATALANLPDIIVHGAARGPFGVMIARGDLAVEIGYLRLAEVQEELMWLCEAARVPVVWATQVLEGLVKRGTPTRAEITDAASAERAECIMLNKGPYLTEALDMLASLVGRMSRHQTKKTARFAPLPW